jgi:hypothetical protein
MLLGIIFVCLSPFIAVGLIYLIYLLSRNNGYFQTSDTDDITCWRPSRDYPGAYWRYNHTNGRFQYCMHDQMCPYYENETTITKRCPDCGYTESEYKK